MQANDKEVVEQFEIYLKLDNETSEKHLQKQGADLAYNEAKTVRDDALKKLGHMAHANFSNSERVIKAASGQLYKIVSGSGYAGGIGIEELRIMNDPPPKQR